MRALTEVSQKNLLNCYYKDDFDDNIIAFSVAYGVFGAPDFIQEQLY